MQGTRMTSRRGFIPQPHAPRLRMVLPYFEFGEQIRREVLRLGLVLWW